LSCVVEAVAIASGEKSRLNVGKDNADVRSNGRLQAWTGHCAPFDEHKLNVLRALAPPPENVVKCFVNQ